ncbi:MAG: 3-keto-5-aminohexanoate cleavage protein [Rhizobiales bacterium]|nr:3-keto-5-aminohexanoate cleavage protein [Hyphomicrobiales bacterium]
MAKSTKAIISCAITGGIHTPTMSEALPVTPAEIARASIDAAEAGASIIHLHARDPETGKPTADPNVFMQFLPHIKQSTTAIVNISTGGGIGMKIEDRIAAAVQAEPEVTSLNMGSMNFGIFPMAARYDNWKHDWEKPYLEATDDFIFANTFAMIEHIITELADKRGVRFEHECYDVGHLYNTAHFYRTGRLKPPIFLQFIFGILGGIGPDLAHLQHMKETADKLFGDDYVFSVLAAGRHQLNFCTASAMMGGSVRVGLEDSLYIGKGELAESNAQQVAKIKRICEDLSIEVASPDEAREILGTKGGDMVKF